MKILVVGVLLVHLAIAYLEDNHENYKIYAGPYNEETEIEEHFTPKNLETLLSFQVNNVHKCNGVLITSLYALAVRRCTELLHDEKHKHKVVLMNEIKSTLLSSVGTVIDKFVKVPGTKQLKLLLLREQLLSSTILTRPYIYEGSYKNGVIEGVAAGWYQNTIEKKKCSIWVSGDLSVNPGISFLSKIAPREPGAILFRKGFLLGICDKDYVYGRLICLKLSAFKHYIDEMTSASSLHETEK